MMRRGPDVRFAFKHQKNIKILKTTKLRRKKINFYFSRSMLDWSDQFLLYFTIRANILACYISLKVTRQRMIRLTFLILLQCLAFLLSAQILAIDYGTQFIKAALVNTGVGKTFSIVENSKSHRKFTNAVSQLVMQMGIYNEERLYEADTLTKRSRGPSNCFIFSRLLIDLHDNPSELERVKKEFILEYMQNAESDQLMAQYVLSGMPEDSNEISLLQATAMIIKHVKF